MKRGQVSIEFIVAVGALFFILLFLAGLSFSKNIELIKSKEYLDKRNDCLKLSSIILEVYVNGNGTIVRDKLEHAATLSPNSRLIEVQNDDSVYCTIPLNAMSDVVLSKGDIEIKNIGDFVNVANI